MPDLRIIKLFVGGMTLLIFVMLGFVIWGISRNAIEVEEGMAKLQSTPSSATWQAQLPAGRIRAIATAGQNLAVLAYTPQGRVVYIYNPVDSRLIGIIAEESLAPTPGVSDDSASQPQLPRD